MRMSLRFVKSDNTEGVGAYRAVSGTHLYVLHYMYHQVGSSSAVVIGWELAGHSVARLR